MALRDGTRPMAARFRSHLFQILAIVVCVAFGLAIIINVQLSGNALWFWYAKSLHQGVKLYADLHIVLQPLFVLEYKAWMQMVGVSCIRIEGLSLLHVLILIFGIFLLLRESNWPDWQKAIVLAGTFFVVIQFNAYLFNDYHITSDILSLYSILLLLWLAKAATEKQELVLSIALGMLAGLSLTNRLNDGAALIAALVGCVPFLARRKKLLATAVAVAMAFLTIAIVVRITGDTFHNYLLNSVLRASGSKGGTGTILADPFLLVPDALKVTRVSGTRVIYLVAVLFGVGALLARKWKLSPLSIIAVQLLLVVPGFLVAPARIRLGFFGGALAQALSVLLVLVSYAVVAVVAVRFVRSKSGEIQRPWDSREIVVVLVFLLTAAGSGSTGGHSQNFFCTSAALLLFVPIFEPFKKYAGWVYPTFLSIMLLMAITGATSKEREAYSWHNYDSSPMFTNRSWYQHPVYGEMYAENNLLQFIIPVCDEIKKGSSGPVELLSLPYPYPNYFCNTPPWHGYVQTFYDTSPRSTIEKLMNELETSPPQWIVYQRELDILSEHEQIYNHGQRLAQRDLDEMIGRKLLSGQWQLVDKRNYLTGDGWMIIRTR